MLEVVRQLAGEDDLAYDLRVARSRVRTLRSQCGHRLSDEVVRQLRNDVITVLQTYFHYCALRMSCVELARSFVYLANHGRDLNGEAVISPLQARQINALMMTSGMYDGAGEFAYRVGMPGKSGVGGGIVAIVPGELSIVVWSPELDASGNSLAGTAALELLSQRIGRSIFNPNQDGSQEKLC